ncbi:FHA domain-containing protein [Actinospica sp. MGRD01-02]|uniref:FHA domain-containing protein n=1 Tax=Actinospica acidithermotolerans TaxID=2828514 RepID=A0A941E935_9ACTN|nr:FHA domain-containing protein [Actinospica acidithermotolerans]MBR7828545.1 FHA domain-containing protein [Actinospica acidithermotolerans]
MTESISRYLPGSWMAFVTAGAWLLADTASEVRLEKCWLELRQTGQGVEVAAEAMLEELKRATAAGAGFAIVYQTQSGTRVVVHGAVVAEITGADGVVCVVRQENGSQTLPGEPVAVRLASSTDDVRGDVATLPIESGIVMASALEYVDEEAARSVEQAEPVQPQAAGRESDEAYLDDFMEPGDARTYIVEASDLDWMSSPSGRSVPAPASAPAAEPEPRSERTLEPEAEPEPGPALEPEAVWPGAPIARPSPSPLEQTLVAPLPEPATPPDVPAPLLAPISPSFPPQQPMMFGATDQPLVTALRCPSGHLTSTESIFCRVCRAAVAPQEPVTVARPCLGRLRLSNGEIYLLDRDAVFGRKPEIPAGRPGPRPNAIALTDDRDVSRNHVEIRLDGWRVLALDLGSMNGTQLAGPNLAPRLLPPGTAQEIVPGSVLTLAPDVWIYFEEER